MLFYKFPDNINTMAYLSSLVIAIAVTAVCICIICCTRRRSRFFTNDEKRIKRNNIYTSYSIYMFEFTQQLYLIHSGHIGHGANTVRRLGRKEPAGQHRRRRRRRRQRCVHHRQRGFKFFPTSCATLDTLSTHHQHDHPQPTPTPPPPMRTLQMLPTS